LRIMWMGSEFQSNIVAHVCLSANNEETNKY
jgi:hypothetical protein